MKKKQNELIVLSIIICILIIIYLYANNLIPMQITGTSNQISTTYKPKYNVGDCVNHKQITNITYQNKKYITSYNKGCDCEIIKSSKTPDVSIYIIPGIGQDYSSSVKYSNIIYTALKRKFPFNKYTYNMYFSRYIDSCNKYTGNNINVYLYYGEGVGCQVRRIGSFTPNSVMYCKSYDTNVIQHEFGHAFADLADLYVGKFSGYYTYNLMGEGIYLDDWQAKNIDSAIKMKNFMIKTGSSQICTDKNLNYKSYNFKYNSYCNKQLCEYTNGIWIRTLVPSYDDKGTRVSNDIYACYCLGKKDPNLTPTISGTILWSNKKGCVNYPNFAQLPEPYP